MFINDESSVNLFILTGLKEPGAGESVLAHTKVDASSKDGTVGSLA